MKKLNLLTVSVVLTTIVICISCQKDFLDKNPLDQISSQTFWKTEGDVNMALAGCYRRLQADFLGYRRVWTDCLSDNAFAHWGYYGIASMTLGVISPSSGGAVNASYYPPYRGIASCNFFLANVEKAQISDEKKALAKAEVRFLRALMYFDLVNFFGDVILYKDLPKSADEAKIAKSPKAEVLAYIHADLDEAISSLPDVAYAGHAVKGSALAIKARVLLYEQKWAEAAGFAQQIMSSGKFSLANNYLGIFSGTSTQLNNPEIIFSTQYLGPTNPTAFVESMDVEIAWYACINPYQNLVDDYECTDGKPITESPLYDPADLTWANRDPRLKLTMRNLTEVWPQPQEAGQTGYVMRKYIDFSHVPFSYSRTDSDQDMVLTRYADVLLMYAEAKNEVSGPDASIYDALDQIRSRPGVNMPPVDRAKYNSKELLRDYIRHERRIELALEGYRYFDLKRWGIIGTILNTLKNPAGIPLVFKSEHYLFPFPQAELDNNPQLEQNPGY
ncbi:MAG: RagB/SusD family nutrient uptake outer membrane protein [Cyclobacteriaceae bacterium]